MPKVAYTTNGFFGPFESINGASDLELPWPFLVWSAISVGRAELIHIIRYREFSLFEIAFRAAMLFANLCEDGSGRIRRSEAYDGLDPSEKGAISYFLGLMFAKGFAERVLGVPWLMHLDVYRQELRPMVLGRSRPDLVGQTTSGEWVAIEAKGRTSNFDWKALERAKQQAQMLATVGGQEPVLRIGMVTHFDSNRLEFTATDPLSDESHERIHLSLTRQRLFEGYYRPFRTWLSNNPQADMIEIAGVVYRAAPVGNVDVTVGLSTNMMDDNFAASPSVGQQHAENEKRYAGSDGVLVELGPRWSTQNMTREPQQRTDTA